MHLCRIGLERDYIHTYRCTYCSTVEHYILYVCIHVHICMYICMSACMCVGRIQTHYSTEEVGRVFMEVEYINNSAG